MAKSLEELQVYQKAMAASAEVSAIIQRPSFNRDPRLRDQLGASSERVASLIAEGFEQSTDRHFAQTDDLRLKTDDLRLKNDD